MLATMKAPPLSKRQVDLIKDIWKELDRIFGEKELLLEVKEDGKEGVKEGGRAECLRRHISYADGQPKRVVDLAVTLNNLKGDPPEPEILLPGETKDDQSWQDHQ